MKDVESLANKIMLVDGMALLFRGFFATSFRGNFMRNADGVPTNGVYQFLRYFLDAAAAFEPSHVICCWDMGSKTFRTEMYDSYKGNREAPPEELIPQFDHVKLVAESLGLVNIGLANYEADDCIGTLAAVFAPEHEVIVLTGDQDMLQLVSENVHVAIMKKGIGNYDVYNQDNFFEKKGLLPEQIVDLKGLMGDSSDNYPGVKGIGEKTAFKLMQEYGTIEKLLEQLEELPKGIQTKISADLDNLHMSRDLARIRCDVDIQCTLDDAAWEHDLEIIKEKLMELQFGNLASRI